MIMTSCLMIYASVEQQIRNALLKNNASFRLYRNSRGMLIKRTCSLRFAASVVAMVAK